MFSPKRIGLTNCKVKMGRNTDAWDWRRKIFPQQSLTPQMLHMRRDQHFLALEIIKIMIQKAGPFKLVPEMSGLKKGLLAFGQGT